MRNNLFSIRWLLLALPVFLAMQTLMFAGPLTLKDSEKGSQSLFSQSMKLDHTVFEGNFGFVAADYEGFIRNNEGVTGRVYENPMPVSTMGTEGVEEVVVITHSASQNIVDNHSVACPASNANSFLRAYDLAADFSISGEFQVSSVEFGVEYLVSNSTPVTLNVYSTSGTFPSGFPGNATLQGTASYTAAWADEGTVVSVPLSATIPAGETMIFEVAVAEGQQGFYIGSNDAGQTDVSYIMAPGCGANIPTDFTDLDPDFDDVHIVLNVVGEEVEDGGASDYCIPEGTNAGRYIDNFSTTGGSENISNMGTGFSTGGYGDFYGTHTVAQEAGEDVSFEADIVGGTAGFRIWVDWNQDGEFDTSEEVAWSSNGYLATQSGSFTVPADALEGETRMRIVSHWLDNQGNIDPCATGFTYGEFEDYKFVVGGEAEEPTEYCIPEGTTASRYINNFSTTGGSENISNMGSGFSTGGYGDFYGTHTVAQAAGEDVSFEADIVGGTAGFRIWVDWNQDGEFDTSEEVAYQSNGYLSSHSGEFEVPADALEGETRMRIVSHWLSTSGDVDPCATGFTYGEFEDYKFVVEGGGGAPSDYCIPEGTNSDRFVNNFSTTGGSDNISNMGSGFSTGGYGDFYDTHTVSQEAGGNVSFEADIEGGIAGFRIWVDWNQDGEFDTSEEVAYQSSGYLSSHSGEFEVPADALEGETRMRIVSHWLSTSGDVDPCATGFTYGEFEDYKFVVEGENGGGTDPSDCEQGVETKGADPDDGWGNMHLGMLANDFVVAQDENFTLEEVTIYFLLQPGQTMNSADLTFYEDTAGNGPGAEIVDASAIGLAASSQNTIANPFGFNLIETVFEFASPYTFEGDTSGETVYWMAAKIDYTGAQSFMETSFTYGTPNEAYWSDDNGATWQSGIDVWGDDMHGVITFSGVCEEIDDGGGIDPTDGCLTTLFASNNGGSPGWTQMFDLTVAGEDVTITSFEVNTSATGGTVNADIYFLEGSYVGNELDSSAWTLVASGSGVGQGEDNPTEIALDDTFDLDANTAYGIAVVIDQSSKYTNGTGANQHYEDAAISLDLGTAVAGLFSGSVFNDRIFNGTVCYEVGGGTDPEPSDYCIPEGTDSSRYINNFSTTGGIINISNMNSGFSTGGYGDFYSTHAVEQIKGQEVNFTADMVGGTFGFRIWVDWNQDGVFDTSEEVAYQSSSYLATQSGTFEIPTNALSGETRMRVVAHWLSTTGDIDPCATGFTYGEFEDYKVIISDMEDCSGTPDGGVASVTPESGNPGSAYVVSAEGYTVANDMTYQWQSNTDGAGWVNEGAASEFYSDFNATAPSELDVEVDWRLEVTCNLSSETSYSDIATFTTVMTYCEPSFSTVEPISRVVIGDVDNASDPTINGSPAYEDFTAVVGNLGTTNTYEVALEGNTNGNFTTFFSIFIDWNQDGVFQPGEMFEIGSIVNSTGTDGQQAVKVIAIPEDAVLGETRMRVIKNWSSLPTEPCGAYSYGQAEDYTIVVFEGDGTGPEPDPEPTFGCDEQFVASNNLENGLFFGGDGNQHLAVDVIVGDDGFDVYGVDLNVFVDGDTDLDFYITFYNDQGGLPGAVHDDNGFGSIHSSDFVGSAFGYDIYNFVVEFDSPVSLDANTTYWMEVESDGTAWEARSTGFFGSAAAFNNDSTGGAWAIGDNELVYALVCESLGVADLSSFDFAYYPNPVRDVLNITSQKGVESVSVFNLTGQKVMNNARVVDGQIDVSNLATGTYVFRVTLDDGQVETFKIIKR